MFFKRWLLQTENMRGWQYGDASEAGAAVDLPLPGLEEEEEGERVYVSV